MQVELKSCPFCGGEAEIHDATRILGLWRLVHRCKVIGYIGIERADKEAAIAAWNTRHQARAEVVGEIVAWLRENDVYGEWREGVATIEAKFGGRDGGSI